MANNGTSPALLLKPSRLLWLTHRQLPHREAVICPADEGQVRLAIALLNDSYERRMGILRQLKRVAEKLRRIPPIERPSVPARMPNGLYEPISWRMALWLSYTIAIQDGSRRERLAARLQHWLDEGEDCDLISTNIDKAQAAKAAAAGSPDRQVGGPGLKEKREVRRTDSNSATDADVNQSRSASHSTKNY